VPQLRDGSGWFSLDFPDGWESRTEDGVSTLESGVGTVYVSGGRHAGGRQASFGRDDFLVRFLASLGLDVSLEAIGTLPGEGCRIYSYCRRGPGDYWRYFSVTDDETALLISYTCPEGQEARDVQEVEEMVRSVRLFPSPVLH
jgi:hypothetical protein